MSVSGVTTSVGAWAICSANAVVVDTVKIPKVKVTEKRMDSEIVMSVLIFINQITTFLKDVYKLYSNQFLLTLF
ncbi:hypothetical protein C7H19_00320 [Aphanothece hegewaldii CCALA 016]|uniref:Uncharacterized protein n=1 Tax=Aphanothece hegewaldii CCALA 016 TaxID=2107694 RepID=A0A2T1M3E0_9CHRO|nr:hypothetical protein C7H19_00320 [Aphanothece hegewaldii CCALA 016]